MPRYYADFHLLDSMKRKFLRGIYSESRSTIHQRLKDNKLIDFSSRKFLSIETLYRHKIKYAFTISPHGMGLDCHRTWEDLILGCIVVVKTSSLDPLYQGLPVVIVDDWDEINEENTRKWLHMFDHLNQTDVRHRLTNDYWWAQIEAAVASHDLSRHQLSHPSVNKKQNM